MPDSRAFKVCLWFTLVFPSSFIVVRYLGWECTIAYAIVVAAVVALQVNLSRRLSSRNLLWLALLTLLLTTRAFLVIYPVANPHAPEVVTGTGYVSNTIYVPLPASSRMSR
jgi:hypothetical protein